MRVLLIDDEKELVSTLSERLELRGIDTDWATSGEEGLEAGEAKSVRLGGAGSEDARPERL